ncbi:ATP-binding protein [Filimonas effusa]|uniref:histidine kinase n=1 Tax=Filimonas effusa TaxID=2508721 RepID=A0A4Q1DF17_9BACT|nr:ATP-binding protein [Filimonas effusa]RXK87219.1 HAMP domain-containing protein [Filimonas effusa]
MNLKIKFVLILALLVSIILLLEAFHLLTWIVIVGGALLIVIGAYMFVRQVTQPLKRLNEQIKRISASNLKERVTLDTGSNELQQIAASFNAMLERLQKGFEVQNSFVHHASHELRTPLANMLAQTEVALKRDLSSLEARQVLQSLREEQQELIELTNSLLLLTQYEKISSSSGWPQVRLDQLLYDTIDLVKGIYPDIRWSVSFSDMPEHELALSVKGNDALLRSACKNLIKNAYQYSTNKNVTITLETGPDTVSIVIDNEGPVLSASEQDRLFIPFFRGANAMGTKGFGLGLLIVSRIVQLHNGKIIYSTPRTGLNRFTVVFGR